MPTDVTRKRIWIDTDPAVTAGNGEVDDAFALVQALRSPELEIVGISAVHGNASADHAYVMAGDILQRAGHSKIPLFRGSTRAGDPCPAATSDALAAALSEGALTIVALGPLTTLAAVLTTSGVAFDNVDELVFVGGRRLGLEFRATAEQAKPFRDMNFEYDVGAAETLLTLGIPFTLAGWEVSASMWITPADLDRLAVHGGECARWLSASARKWQRDWQRQFAAPGFTPFDTLAVGWLLWPELFSCIRRPSRIWHDGKRPLFGVDERFEGPVVNYLANVDYPAFHDRLITRLIAG